MASKAQQKDKMAKGPSPAPSQALSNIPNLLTLARIALIPIIMAAFYTDSHIGRWDPLESTCRHASLSIL